MSNFGIKYRSTSSSFQRGNQTKPLKSTNFSLLDRQNPLNDSSISGNGFSIRKVSFSSIKNTQGRLTSYKDELDLLEKDLSNTRKKTKVFFKS